MATSVIATHFTKRPDVILVEYIFDVVCAIYSGNSVANFHIIESITKSYRACFFSFIYGQLILILLFKAISICSDYWRLMSSSRANRDSKKVIVIDFNETVDNCLLNYYYNTRFIGACFCFWWVVTAPLPSQFQREISNFDGRLVEWPNRW